MFQPVIPRTAADLQDMTSPVSVVGGNLEAYAYTLFDVSAVATGALVAPFFNVARASQQLSNLQTPGALTSPEYFKIWSIHVTPLIPVAFAASAPAAVDMDNIVRVNLGTIELEIQSKVYGPWPIMEAAGLGGVTGFGLSLADATASSFVAANNGIQGNGIGINGSLALLPNAGFRLNLRWNAAITLTATTNVHVAMRGVLYRAIK